MIVENNVSLIVSTCGEEEKGLPKCNKFWPDTNLEPISFVVSQSDNKLKIKVSLIKFAKESKYLYRREMKIEKPDSSFSLITQIQFVGWPDHGIPEG